MRCIAPKIQAGFPPAVGEGGGSPRVPTNSLRKKLDLRLTGPPTRGRGRIYTPNCSRSMIEEGEGQRFWLTRKRGVPKGAGTARLRGRAGIEQKFVLRTLSGK